MNDQTLSEKAYGQGRQLGNMLTKAELLARLGMTDARGRTRYSKDRLVTLFAQQHVCNCAMALHTAARCL